MGRNRSNPLLRRPYEYLDLETRLSGRLPRVIVASIPSKQRKHSANSGYSVLKSMQVFSGSIPHDRDAKLKARDRIIKRLDQLRTHGVVVRSSECKVVVIKGRGAR